MRPHRLDETYQLLSSVIPSPRMPLLETDEVIGSYRFSKQGIYGGGQLDMRHGVLRPAVNNVYKHDQ